MRRRATGGRWTCDARRTCSRTRRSAASWTGRAGRGTCRARRWYAIEREDGWLGVELGGELLPNARAAGHLRRARAALRRYRDRRAAGDGDLPRRRRMGRREVRRRGRRREGRGGEVDRRGEPGADAGGDGRAGGAARLRHQRAGRAAHAGHPRGTAACGSADGERAVVAITSEERRTSDTASR